MKPQWVRHAGRHLRRTHDSFCNFSYRRKGWFANLAGA